MIYLFCDPGGARTHDPMIKSHLLYQLSHGVNLFCWSSEYFPIASAKLQLFFGLTKFYRIFLQKNL